MPALTSALSNPATETFRPSRALRVKYGLERALASALALLLLPLGLLIAVAIALESLLAGETPHVFIIERRLSAGRAFSLFKFRIFRHRSLREHRAQAEVRSLKGLERPEHLTRVGRFLKAFYLDEMPQLLNVASGSMSLVGPRPYYVGDWEREPLLDIPARRLLKAGLTGPFQSVKGQVSGLERVNQIDSGYFDLVRQSSGWELLKKDLEILIRSARTALEGRGL